MKLRDKLKELPGDEVITVGQNTSYHYVGTVSDFRKPKWKQVRDGLMDLQIISTTRQAAADHAVKIILEGEGKGEFWFASECKEWAKKKRRVNDADKQKKSSKER